MPRGIANTNFCFPQTCCLSVVNEKSRISGFNYRIFAKFCVQVPKKGKILNFEGWIFAHFLLKSAEKLIYVTFFYMELLTNYVGVIVPSFKLFYFVELVLRLYIENASKSSCIPGLQTVWSVKLASLRKLRLANITFLKPQMHTYSLI